MSGRKDKLELLDLNEGQRRVVEAGKRWWQSDEQVLVVDGEPGTGKTSVVQFLLAELKDAEPLFSAPTHEAAGQLGDRLEDNAVCETTHRALGLKPDKSAEELVFTTEGRPKSYRKCNVLILDEASMADYRSGAVSDKQKGLWNHTLDQYDKIIALGDWAQLPPVGSLTGESPVFEQDYRTETLTKVERHEGDILRYVQEVRSQIRKPIRRIPKVFGEVQEMRVKFAGHLPEFSEAAKREIAEGRGRVLCWTNGKTQASIVPGVREYNQYFREFKFGRDNAARYPFLESEVVVLNSPSYLFQGDAGKHEELADLEFKESELKRMATTNARGLVTRVDTATVLGVECYKLNLDLVRGGKTVVFVPTGKGKVKLDRMVKEIGERAKAVGGEAATKLFRKKHTFTDLFTFVVPSYAQTGQKSQGSSIESVYVDVRNILQMRPTEWHVAYKLLNVVCSRSTKSLTLIRGER